MHISLIGMSNIGKSYWARRRLEAEAGFERLSCDDLIEAKLAPHLKKLGYKGIHDVAKWMGQPFAPQYPETSQHYMDCERAVMLEVIDHLKNAKRPMVIDTTGSVIYTGDTILKQLSTLSKPVYLQASDTHVSKLFQNYISNPKPVYWGESFQPLSGETHEETLKRCYPELLKFRAARYQTLAHITIPYEQHRAPEATWEKLMAEGHHSAA